MNGAFNGAKERTHPAIRPCKSRRSDPVRNRPVFQCVSPARGSLRKAAFLRCVIALLIIVTSFTGCGTQPPSEQEQDRDAAKDRRGAEGQLPPVRRAE